MEVDFQLAAYLVTYYPQFLTKEEESAQRHLMGTVKIMHGRDDIAAQEEAISRYYPADKIFFTKDPDVLLLAKDGYKVFVLRTGSRIFAEHGDEISLNLCPKCGRLARTPSAKQCRHCFHDWHQQEQRSK